MLIAPCYPKTSAFGVRPDVSWMQTTVDIDGKHCAIVSTTHRDPVFVVLAHGPHRVCIKSAPGGEPLLEEQFELAEGDRLALVIEPRRRQGAYIGWTTPRIMQLTA